MSDLRVVDEFREQLLAAEPPPERKRRRWAFRHPLLASAAALVVAGGIATAATGEFPIGDPLPSPPSPAPRDPRPGGIGSAIPGAARLEAIRANDPADGPPWGVRVIPTDKGGYCEQIGRVVDGRLGVIGDDGKFHEAPYGGNACFGPGPSGRTRPPGRNDGVVSSGGFNGSADGQPIGGYGPTHCMDTLAAARSFDPSVVLCDGREPRTLATGTTGPRVVAIELEEVPGRKRTRYPVVDGRYLIAFAGKYEDQPRLRAYAVFDDGTRRRAWNQSGRRRPPVHTDAGFAEYVAMKASPAVTTPDGQVVVTFRAPRDAEPKYGDYYTFVLSGPRGCLHQERIPFYVRTSRRLRRGDTVRVAIRPPGLDGSAPRAWCRGRYSGTAAYRERIAAGTFEFEVR